MLRADAWLRWDWQWQGFVTQVAGVTNTGSHKNASPVVGNGGSNIFSDPSVALNAFQYTLPRGIGSRNPVRGVTDSVVFDVASLSLDIGSRGTFGRYSGLLTQPRVMQFGARYEF